MIETLSHANGSEKAAAILKRFLDSFEGGEARVMVIYAMGALGIESNKPILEYYRDNMGNIPEGRAAKLVLENFGTLPVFDLIRKHAATYGTPAPAAKWMLRCDGRIRRHQLASGCYSAFVPRRGSSSQPDWKAGSSDLLLRLPDYCGAYRTFSESKGGYARNAGTDNPLVAKPICRRGVGPESEMRVGQLTCGVEEMKCGRGGT